MFKKIWKYLNGKKRIIGITLVYVGKGLQQNEDTAIYGSILEYVGLAIAGGGVVHAIKKNKKRR